MNIDQQRTLVRNELQKGKSISMRSQTVSNKNQIIELRYKFADEESRSLMKDKR